MSKVHNMSGKSLNAVTTQRATKKKVDDDYIISTTQSLHKKRILQKLYNRKCFDSSLMLTEVDFKASNANQYLIQLERSTLIIRPWVKIANRAYKGAYINPQKIEVVKTILGITNGVAK